MFDLTVSRLSTCSIASALGLCSIHLFFTREKLASLIHKDLKKQNTKDAQGMYKHCKLSLILNDGNTEHNVLCWRPAVFFIQFKKNILCFKEIHSLLLMISKMGCTLFTSDISMASISLQFRRGLTSLSTICYNAIKERYLPSSAQLIVVNPTDYVLLVTDNQQLMPTHVVSIYWCVCKQS